MAPIASIMPREKISWARYLPALACGCLSLTVILAESPEQSLPEFGQVPRHRTVRNSDGEVVFSCEEIPSAWPLQAPTTQFKGIFQLGQTSLKASWFCQAGASWNTFIPNPKHLTVNGMLVYRHFCPHMFFGGHGGVLYNPVLWPLLQVVLGGDLSCDGLRFTLNLKWPSLNSDSEPVQEVPIQQSETTKAKLASPKELAETREKWRTFRQAYAEPGMGLENPSAYTVSAQVEAALELYLPQCPQLSVRVIGVYHHQPPRLRNALPPELKSKSRLNGRLNGRAAVQFTPIPAFSASTGGEWSTHKTFRFISGFQFRWTFNRPFRKQLSWRQVPAFRSLSGRQGSCVWTLEKLSIAAMGPASTKEPTTTLH